MAICLAVTDADWQLTKDVISVVGTSVSAIAAVATVGLAFYFGRGGLNTWRRQLKATADHELARRILIDVYGFRDALLRARGRHIFPEETLSIDGSLTQAQGPISGFIGEVNAYRRRFRALDSSKAVLCATLIEAEAVWDESLGRLMQPIFSLADEFFGFINVYTQMNDPREPQEKREFLMNHVRRRDARQQHDESRDEYLEELKSAVKAVEEYLKSKLIR